MPIHQILIKRRRSSNEATKVRDHQPKDTRRISGKKALYPDQMRKRLKFSWSNWGFGLEDFAVSCARLEKAGIRFIELHGNHYGADLGYHPEEIRTILADHGITCAGVCGMFSADNDLSSNRHIQRQAAIDYIKREVAFKAEMGGKYMLVCPAAVGRSKKYDDSEIERSIDSLSHVAHLFTDYGVRAAIEPIRAAETSIVHTFAEAKEKAARSLADANAALCSEGERQRASLEAETAELAAMLAEKLLDGGK